MLKNDEFNFIKVKILLNFLQTYYFSFFNRALLSITPILITNIKLKNLSKGIIIQTRHNDEFS